MAKRPLPDPVLKARLRTMLDADRQELLLRYPFFGRIICSCELVPVDDANLETACSDGRRIFIAERWYSALPDTQRLAVLAHEVLHIVLRHFFRLGNRDRMRFNYAADIEIHFLLEAENFEEPVVLPYQPEWEGLTAEEIYECLPRELPQDAPEHLYPDVNSPCCKRAPSPDASQSEEQQDAEEHPERGPFYSMAN